jgi:pectate lyase
MVQRDHNTATAPTQTIEKFAGFPSLPRDKRSKIEWGLAGQSTTSVTIDQRKIAMGQQNKR